LRPKIWGCPSQIRICSSAVGLRVWPFCCYILAAADFWCVSNNGRLRQVHICSFLGRSDDNGERSRSRGSEGSSTESDNGGRRCFIALPPLSICHSRRRLDPLPGLSILLRSIAGSYYLVLIYIYFRICDIFFMYTPL